MRRIAALVGLALIGGACSWPTPSLPAVHHRTLGPGEVWLPEARWTDRWGRKLLCTGGGFGDGYVLHGAPDDPRSTWYTTPEGHRVEIGWPADHSAGFGPELEVLDDRGRLIAREGSAVTGGCVTAEPGIDWIDLGPVPCLPRQCPDLPEGTDVPFPGSRSIGRS